MRLIDADKLQAEYKEYHDGKRLLLLDVQPTVEPPSRYIAKIEINKEDLEDLVAEKVEEIKETMSGNWVPCSERLPEEGERVLCTHLGGLDPNRQVIEHVYEGGQFTLGWEMDMNPSSSTFGQRYMGKVVAWMPLPKPYGGDKG